MVINLTQVCTSGDHGTCLTQHWVNYLGIYTTVASTAAAIGVARLADRVKGRLKEAIIILLTLASLVFLFLSLISVGVFTFDDILYVQILVTILLIIGEFQAQVARTLAPTGAQGILFVCLSVSKWCKNGLQGVFKQSSSL